MDVEYVREQTDLPILVRLDSGRFLRESEVVADGKQNRLYMWDTKTNAAIIAPGIKYTVAYVPYVHYCDAAIQPVGETKDEWEIFWLLAREVSRIARERNIPAMESCGGRTVDLKETGIRKFTTTGSTDVHSQLYNSDWRGEGVLTVAQHQVKDKWAWPTLTAWEPYQFPNHQSYKWVTPGLMNPLHFAGGEGHIGWRFAIFEPGTHVRDTRATIRPWAEQNDKERAERAQRRAQTV